jgi:hypothetical protein
MTCNRWKPMDMTSHRFRFLPSNPFQLKKIMCSSGTPWVQFLAIKPEIKKKHTKKCKYRRTEQRTKKDGEYCSLRFPEQWVHLHVAPYGEEENVLNKKHYLIIFVERIELGDAQAIFKKFKNTVNWLGITKNEYEFRIVHFAVDPKEDPYKSSSNLVDKNTATSTFEISFKKEIKEEFGTEDAVKYELVAAGEDMGNKEGKSALGDNGRMPTMLNIYQKSNIGSNYIYEFNIATIGKGNLPAYACGIN